MKRGRPAKEKPYATEAEIRETKKMIKEDNGYEGAKLRSTIYPRKRPTLMRNLRVNTDHYQETGEIDYERGIAARVAKEDREYIEQYEKDMKKVWIIDHALAQIQDDLTRAIAEDTIIRNHKVVSLQQKYNLSQSKIWNRKRDAIKQIAGFIREGI